MSGTGNNERNTMWKSDWDIRSTSSKDFDCISDTVSQHSDQHADEQSCSGASGVKERMRQLFENHLYTDVTFYPKNDRSSSISAHRALLAVGSPFFAKKFFGGDTKDVSCMKMEVQITNMSFTAFSNIVRYLYTDEVFFESDAMVLKILEGSELLEIQSLVERCKSHFATLQLTEENVCTKLQLGISNNIDTLVDRCVKYIQENTHKVINSTDFLRSSFSTIREICKLPSLNLRSEMALLEAVMNWDDSHSPVESHLQIKSLLKYIRFLTLTATELGKFIKIYPDVLTSDEALQIMLYLHNPPRIPNFDSLPSWCNKNSTSRCFFVENQRKSRIGNSIDQDSQIRKVVFLLKQTVDYQHLTELNTSLQMKCLSGFHQLKAIKLSFQAPVDEKSIISSLTIDITHFPSKFKLQEIIEIQNSLQATIAFSKVIYVRKGETVHIEAVAQGIQFYKFLGCDETGRSSPNPHFQCSIKSQTSVGRLFFISEIEYGPQRNRGPVNYRKLQRKC